MTIEEEKIKRKKQKKEKTKKFNRIGCVCLCMFISFHRKGLSLLSITVDAIPEFRPAMLC